MTPEQIEQLAANGGFSSFEGGQNALDMYTGYGDHLVDFAGDASSFLNSQTDSGRIFMVNITNNTDADRNLVLTPGYTSDGRIAGALTFTDGTNDYGFGAGKTIVVSGDPKSYQNFINFVHKNPVQILGMKFRAATNANQIEQTLTIRPLSPFKDLESIPVNLTTYQNEDTYKDKVVTVPRKYILSDQVETLFKILDGEVLTVTWFTGPILNTTAALDKKVKSATATATKVNSMSPAQLQKALGR